jgi:hypothetical protein
MSQHAKGVRDRSTGIAASLISNLRSLGSGRSKLRSAAACDKLADYHCGTCYMLHVLKPRDAPRGMLTQP